MTGNDVADRETSPFVIEGSGENALKIHFESEQSRREYLKIQPRRPEACSLDLYKSFEDDEAILWD
jgi:hypothetical protein